MTTKVYTVKLTCKQVEAVRAAFPVDSDLNFSERLRALVAGGLALQGIEWPPTPQHGGKRSKRTGNE